MLTRQLHDGRLKKSYFALAADERRGKTAFGSEKKDPREDNSKENNSKENNLQENNPGEKVIEEMSLTDYILKNTKTRTAEIVAGPNEKAGSRGKQNAAAKKARLTCKVLKKEADVLYCRIDIQTGRFHQIRAQMSHAKMPLLGDRKYGTESSQLLTDQRGIRQLCLCADRLVFLHPITGMKLEYEVSPSFADVDRE
ncbi:MAG: hypothetical protein IK078_06430 [Lachnospiraceae bacterium]|nr:hypothetical protein [Lachnospiraceae bacterium]